MYLQQSFRSRMERWHHPSHTSFINRWWDSRLCVPSCCQRSNKHFILEMTGVLSELQHWLCLSVSPNKQINKERAHHVSSLPLLSFLIASSSSCVNSSFPVGSCLLSLLSAVFALFSSYFLSFCFIPSGPLVYSPLVYFPHLLCSSPFLLFSSYLTPPT